MAQAASGSEPQGSFGATLLGQGGAAANQNASCAPTSTANGLSYLYNVNPGAFAGGSPNNFATVNGLSADMGVGPRGATYGTATGIANGAATWLAANDPAISVSGQYAPATANNTYSQFLLGSPVAVGANIQQAVPSAVSLASYLNSKDGVELGLQWGTLSGTGTSSAFTAGNGGHFVTLQSINLSFDSTLGLYDGSITYLDPWGDPKNATPSNTGQFVTGSLILLSSGYLDVYNIAAQTTPTAEENSEDALTTDEFGVPAGLAAGQIMVDLVESTPDGGTTALMLGAGFFGIAALRRKLS
jgi:hypothetical protein